MTVNSCVLDTVYNCKIKNDSIDKIQITIIFDKSYLDSLYSKQKSKYILFLKHHIGQDSGVSIINFDTLNMRVDYEVLPITIFTLEHGMFSPDYLSYKYITIFGKDTITLHDKGEIDKAFKKKGGDYILTIE